MSIVGIDQSYTGFGYCINGDARKKVFSASKYPEPEDRLFAVEEWLFEWLTIENRHDPVTGVFMEGYANAAKFGREMAGELGWAVKRTVIEAVGVTPVIVPPTSLKKFVTGSGGAKKNVMLLHVHKRWHVEFSDDNQADSFSLEKFGQAWFLDPAAFEALPKYQQEAVLAVKHPKPKK